jgi:L-rhamnose isomerase/sugar isomerase
MLDQSHNVTDPVESLLESAVSLQRAYAQALMVNRGALREAQDANDALIANRTLRAAVEIDVEPVIKMARMRMGGAIDPVGVFRASRYRQCMAAARPQELTGKSGIV